MRVRQETRRALIETRGLGSSSEQLKHFLSVLDVKNALKLKRNRNFLWYEHTIDYL